MSDHYSVYITKPAFIWSVFICVIVMTIHESLFAVNVTFRASFSQTLMVKQLLILSLELSIPLLCLNKL